MPRIHGLTWTGFALGLTGGLMLWLSQCPWRTCTAPQPTAAELR